MLSDNQMKMLIESDRYAPIADADRNAMALMLENTVKDYEQSINEGSLSSDVAQFTPILPPLVRRVFPNLIANEILGVQPMTMPTGYIYALVHNYIGDGNNFAQPNQHAFIVETDFVPTEVNGVIQEDIDIDVGSTIFETGKVLYKEGNKILVAYTGATRPAGATIGAEVNTAKNKVTGLFTNEASFLRVLPHYTGTYSTVAGEQLAKDMREVGFSITKKSIEAKTRALKGRYTVEMYQDLKAQHGLNADDELMSLMSYEIQAEIDRDVVEFVNAHSKVVPDMSFPVLGGNNYTGVGRWEIERYRAQAVKISKESALIGIETKRGQGNILLVSPKVATMLEQVGNFMKVPVQSSVNVPPAGGIAGTFDNRFKVVVDQYALNDYCTVIYKGADRRDGMGFFAPYVPLNFTKVTMQESGQPAVIAKSRYALTTIPGVVDPNSDDRAQTYAHTFAVDFTNTILAGATDYNYGAI